jgi:hypothetical protein
VDKIARLQKLRHAAWRRQVPFTNQQIADAFLQMAALATEGPHKDEQIRKCNEIAEKILHSGRLSLRAYINALPMLVKTCELCPKPAHYRIGAVGRCDEHRDVPSENRLRLLRNTVEVRHSDYEARRKLSDRYALDRARSRARRKVRSGKSKA